MMLTLIWYLKKNVFFDKNLTLRFYSAMKIKISKHIRDTTETTNIESCVSYEFNKKTWKGRRRKRKTWKKRIGKRKRHENSRCINWPQIFPRITLPHKYYPRCLWTWITYLWTKRDSPPVPSFVKNPTWFWCRDKISRWAAMASLPTGQVSS